MTHETEQLLDFCQKNAEELSGVDNVVVNKAILITTLADAEGEWIVTIGTDACGNDLCLWDRLGLLRFSEIDVEGCLKSSRWDE